MGDTGFMPELVKFLDAGFENCVWDEPEELFCVPQYDCDEFASENLWCFKLSFLKQQIDFDFSFRFHFYIPAGIFIFCLFASIECLGERIFIVKLGDMIMFENCVWNEPEEFACVRECDLDEFAWENFWEFFFWF